jgi:hypothetical protein
LWVSVVGVIRDVVLTDAQWGVIEPLLPCSDGVRGRPFRSHRQVIEGIIYRYRCGIPWRDLPADFGPWQTVWKRHRRFAGDGTWHKFTFTGLVASGLAALIVGLAAPADAAPRGGESAQQTINSLMAEGYKVIINKVGTTPLDEATVVAVRPGRPVTQTVTDSDGHSFQKVLYTTVYVDVK